MNTEIIKWRRLLKETVEDYFSVGITSRIGLEKLDEMYSDKSKDIVVPWSGGMDSTYLLASLAYKYGTRKRPVVAVTVCSENIAQRANERKARRKLRRIFKKLNLHIVYSNSQQNLNHCKYLCDKSSGIQLGQPAMWAGIMPILSNGNCIVNFAYIKGDDIWHVMESFKRAFSSIAEILGLQLDLVFPMEYTSKAHIYLALKQMQLLDYTWYCESDANEPCGFCSSCLKVKHVERDIEETIGTGSEISDVLDEVE